MNIVKPDQIRGNENIWVNWSFQWKFYGEGDFGYSSLVEIEVDGTTWPRDRGNSSIDYIRCNELK